MSNADAPKTIEGWRRRIEEIDRQLVALLDERSRRALQIGPAKTALRLPIYQPGREREILANAERANQGSLADTAIRRLFERILDEARSLERQERARKWPRRESTERLRLARHFV